MRFPLYCRARGQHARNRRPRPRRSRCAAVTSFAEGTAVLQEFRALHREGERRRQGRGSNQLYRRTAGGAAVRGRQCGAHASVVDMANVTGAFYTNLMPEADGLKLERQASRAAAQERHLRLHQAAAQPEAQLPLPGAAIPQRSVSHLSQQEDRQARLHRASRSGSRRSTRTWLRRWAAPTVTTAPGEVYTALERGVVGGCRLAGHRHLRSRLGEGNQVPAWNPPFYSVGVGVLVNMDAWKRPQRRAAEGVERRGAVARRISTARTTP